MLPDESGDKSGVQENLDVLPYTSLSECSHTPSPVKDSDDPEQNTDREEEEYAKYGEIHIIELRKGDKPLGIHLVDVHTSTSSEEYVNVL